MSNIASTGSAIEKHEVTCDLASKRKRAERDVLPFFRFKLRIVILSAEKNPHSHLRLIQRCFALLNMTF